MPVPTFTCSVCNSEFDVPQKALDQYPNWRPRFCRQHSPKRGMAQPSKVSAQAPKARVRSKPQKGDAAPDLTPEQARARFSAGPQTGIFTDGGCRPNPGPGGWGLVWVHKGEIVVERRGYDPSTTNNRMELTALIEAFKLIPDDVPVDVYTDSNLAAQTINDWAAGWARRGWTRKGGEIKNLDLVKELYALAGQHPKARIQWLPSHQGIQWNEYADALATEWTRGKR
jgi:ribonuclease HI